MKKVPISKNFVVFEGIDGAGKSTQAQFVASILDTHQLNATTTREPFDGIIGTYIRTLLQDATLDTLSKAYKQNIESTLLAYLFTADRCEHLYANNGILHLLSTHDIVICDRYLFSAIAYQGESEIDILTRELNARFPLPQIVIYFDISPEAAMQRMQAKHKDSLETLENLQAVYNRYKTVLQEYEQNYTATSTDSASDEQMHILHIDATQSVEDVSNKIVEYILSIIHSNNAQ